MTRARETADSEFTGDDRAGDQVSGDDRSGDEVSGKAPFLPIPVAELELSSADPVASANAAGQIALLVRLHGVPLGTVNRLAPGTGAAPDLRAIALEKFSTSIAEHLRRDGQPVDDLARSVHEWPPEGCALVVPEGSETVSVVICTLGEDDRLRQTVESVLDQTHRQLELIVVDNQPASGLVTGALAAVSDPRLRIVPEPRRGLSVARNTGLAAASGAVVAYTDDDAYADPNWVRQLSAPFRVHPDVVCVTGLVLPAELTTTAQLWFEEFGAFDKGFDRLVWSAREGDPALADLGRPGEHGALFPYSAGVFGSGNNMAFRAAWLRAHGEFDVALGAGTPTRGGEDLDAFLTVMLSGGVIVYEPRALVRHFARADLTGLRTQMFGYGSGMAAVIVKHLAAGPGAAVGIARRLPAGLRKLLDPRSEKNERKTRAFPPELSRAELKGYLAGTALYARSRRNARRLRLGRPANLG